MNDSLDEDQPLVPVSITLRNLYIPSYDDDDDDDRTTNSSNTVTAHHNYNRTGSGSRSYRSHKKKSLTSGSSLLYPPMVPAKLTIVARNQRQQHPNTCNIPTNNNGNHNNQQTPLYSPQRQNCNAYNRNYKDDVDNIGDYVLYESRKEEISLNPSWALDEDVFVNTDNNMSINNSLINECTNRYNNCKNENVLNDITVYENLYAVFSVSKRDLRQFKRRMGIDNKKHRHLTSRGNGNVGVNNFENFDVSDSDSTSESSVKSGKEEDVDSDIEGKLIRLAIDNSFLDMNIDGESMFPTSFSNGLKSNNKSLGDCKNNKCGETSKQNIIIGEIPLHPLRLRRLPSTSSQASLTSYCLNTVIVSYSDGSVRILPDVYRLLVKHSVIDQTNVSDFDHKFIQEENLEDIRRTRRFSEAAFDILDGVSEPSSSANVTPNRRVSDIPLFDDEAFSLLSDAKKLLPLEHQEIPVLNPAPYYINDLREDDNPSEKEISHHNSAYGPFEHNGSLEVIRKRLELDLEQQNENLRFEESALQSDLIALQECIDDVENMMKNENVLSEKLLKLKGDIEFESLRLNEISFFEEARQLKLLTDLRRIYPIQCISGKSYAIRGLEIPIEMNTLDDHLSSALGYVAHLVLKSSQFLHVPLRFEIHYAASRSYIFDMKKRFPLFKTNVDKSLFDKAITLLKRDIERLMENCGMSYNSSEHMLCNLNYFFDQLTEGGQR